MGPTVNFAYLWWAAGLGALPVGVLAGVLHWRWQKAGATMRRILREERLLRGELHE